MRIDGRKANELRPVIMIPGFSTYAEGSVLIKMGQTHVLCNLTVEEDVPRWMKIQNKPGGWVTAEYAMLPRATHQRTPRETGSLGGRTMEIRRLVGRSLRAAVDLEKLGARTLILDCDVLQADGGTRTAAITGAYTALAIGVRKLIQQGLVTEQVFRSPVAAVSVGVIGEQCCLDLCYLEDSQAEVDANVVMNAAGEFIEFQGTSEGRPYSKKTMDELINLAYRGIGELLSIQQQTLAAFT